MLEIKLNCCEGDPNKMCYKTLCPWYRNARAIAEARIPYVGTGFGNLYRPPDPDDILREVREKLNKTPNK